jgi:hypothetical protein
VVPVLEDDKDEHHEADGGEERAHGDAHPEHHDSDREQQVHLVLEIARLRI